MTNTCGIRKVTVSAKDVREDLTARLVTIFDKVAGPGWTWFEDGLTYDNAKLAHALIVSGRATGQTGRIRSRHTGLALARRACRPRSSGQLRPIGSNGFYRRNGARADFDQQPIEAQSHGVGLSGSLPRHGRPVVVRTGAARLRLVPRLERSRAGTLRPRDWRLPRWAARGSEPTKTRERNRRWPFSCRLRKCG